MKNIHKRFFTSLLFLSIVYYSFINLSVLLIFLIVLNYFVLIEFNFIFKKIFQKKKFFSFISTLFSLIYSVIFSLIIWISLSSLKSFEIFTILFILLICISTDVGGYMFGKIIGGKKLISVSPSKTYSGAIGSLILSLITAYFFYEYYNNIFNIGLNILIIKAVSISLISQCGDLFISYLKRKAKIKDTGRILPGHGGILDRIDGILLALPIGVLLI